MTLKEQIAEEIQRLGPIPFARYMELCLYAPDLGYYSRKREQFGKAGDFYTSSDVHAVFGRLLARQFDEMWRAMGAPPSIEIVELGPGRGLFAQDVLDWTSKKFWDFHDALTYRMVESSAGLCDRLRQRFAERIAKGQVAIYATMDELPPAPEHSIIFANEFFDALPLEVLAACGEMRVGYDDGRFVETFVPPSLEALEYLDRYGVHPGEGERIEARLLDQHYMVQIGSRLHAGFVVLIDYGYTREELLAGRSTDTLRAFRQHAVSGNPYEAPGEQDITAHVNFTALREIGQTAGLDHLALLSQAQFLMGIGEPNQFADAFEEAGIAQERTKVAMQLKHLIMPGEMGEAFQVLVMRKGVPKDKAARLSGIAFARDL
ncbi:MAG TPA: SAM-dependent methyltransferase [Terriglobales bacterium]|nr:SAM-dependent methyltransferase [Terriglobales bacterium]